ncbi:SGNH/GDSL hydrolase family protein [Methylobacterium durans]|uniref:SGNH/GDSL hydrolase family protein n=1 Tax=Methylobacterium durans TaxID=2202825 RepID=UPI003C6D3CCF
MAFPQTADPDVRTTMHGLRPVLLPLVALLQIGSALAQAPEAAPEPPRSAPTVVSPPTAAAAPAGEPLDPSLSPECRVPGSKLYTLAKLQSVKAALKEKRPVRVLAVGSTSAGPGASASYPVKLETALERSLPDVDVVVEARGLQGEIASGAAERLRSMVADVEPDLVVWQVGTHDALARVELDAFADALDDTVKWIKSHDIDVVLVDPVYTASLAQDEYYLSIVRKVQEVAAREGVPLVQRYAAMRFLSGRTDKGEDHMLGRQFRLNDLGLRCMAEHVTRAITLSLLQPDTTGTAGPVLGKSLLPGAKDGMPGPQVNPTPDAH